MGGADDVDANLKPVKEVHTSQRPRIDLNKRFLPSPNTTTA